MKDGMNGDLHAGMKNRSPEPVDASMKLPGKNIDMDSTRSKVAPQPKELGPRTA